MAMSESLRERRAQLANRPLSHDKFREAGDAAKILRYRLCFGHLDPEVGLKELDEFQDPSGVDDAHFDQGVVIQWSPRKIAKEIILYDEVGQFRSDLRLDLRIHTFSNE